MFYIVENSDAVSSLFTFLSKCKMWGFSILKAEAGCSNATV